MNVDFINPVINSVKNVLSTMGKLPYIEVGQPYIPKEGEMSCGVVTGLMSMVGRRAKASVALSFSEPAILGIANNFLPGEQTYIDCMVTDLVGEFTNMVLGDAKRQFEARGLFFDMSLPIIIKGQDHLIAHNARAQVIRVPLESQHGVFCVEGVYEECKLPNSSS